MNRKILTVVAAALLTSAGAFAAAPRVQPKITMKQAQATALKVAPGKMRVQELENEGGKLIYSFDIITSKTEVTEVNVDAMTGKVVAVQRESLAKEAAEQKQEAKAKAKTTGNTKSSGH